VNSSAKNVSQKVVLSYSAASLVATTLHGAGGNLMPTFYAENTSASLAGLGLALVLARSFDAITDPAIGLLSDRTRTRLGGRKPWMLAGCPLAMAGVYFLLNPSYDVSWLYMMFWFMIVSLSWTMIEIPHMAWGSELANTYNDRTRLFAMRTLLGAVGSMLFFMMPFMPFFEGGGYTAEVMSANALMLIVLLPICIGITVKFTPTVHKTPSEMDLLAANMGFKERVKYFVTSFAGNRPFQVFIVIFILWGIGVGMYGPLFFIYVSNELQLADKLAYFTVATMVCQMLATPIWMKIMTRFGKNKGWAASSFLALVGFMLLLVIEPGSESFLPILLVGAFLGAAQAGGVVAPYAVLADIVEYDQMKSGEKRNGAFYAVYLLVQKANIAIGAGLGLSLAGFFGYQAGMQNTEQAVLWLEIAMAWIPGVLILLSAIVVLKFPLTEDRLEVVQRWLARRQERPEVLTTGAKEIP